MNKRRAVVLAIACAAMLVACADVEDDKRRARTQLKENYLAKLDAWVAEGGGASRQRELADTCGLLVQMFASDTERDRLLTTMGDEFIRRVGYCNTITQARVNQLTRDEHLWIAQTCADSPNELTHILCERAGFL